MAEFRGKQIEKSQQFQRVRTTACNMKKINQELHHAEDTVRNERKKNPESQRIRQLPCNIQK